VDEPYKYSSADLAKLILMKFYPERSDRESSVLRDFLINHGAEFDRFSFSVKVGQGNPPDPNAPPKIQRQQVTVSKRRIDLLAWRGTQPVIVEVKYLVTPASLGQIQTYRVLFLEENPDAPSPELVVIGAASTPDTIRALQAHNVTVQIYPSALTPADAAGSGV